MISVDSVRSQFGPKAGSLPSPVEVLSSFDNRVYVVSGPPGGRARRRSQKACWVPAVMWEGESRVAAKTDRRGKEIHDVFDKEKIAFRGGRSGHRRGGSFAVGLGGRGPTIVA